MTEVWVAGAAWDRRQVGLMTEVLHLHLTDRAAGLGLLEAVP
jgi:hypothetical protein